MEPASFAKEDDFQRLLSRFPELLVGDQVNPQNLRRWLLIRREVPISTGEVGALQWSIDHVFLDQEGVPTLVEIKRQATPASGARSWAKCSTTPRTALPIGR